MEQRIKTIGIGFHDVVESLSEARPIAPGHTTLYTIDRVRLREHLLAIRSVTPVTTLYHIGAGGSQPPVLLTFDDGAVSAYTIVAPELEECGWQGHFFITTDWIEKPGFLNKRQIRELSRRGHIIGSHSRTHPDRMSALNFEDQVQEWSESCDLLSDIVGERVRTASTPGGYFSLSVAKAAAVAGLTTLFTSEPTMKVSALDSCLLLGRYSVRRSTSPATAASIAAGDWRPRWAQSIRWAAAKTLKRACGPAYLSLRHALWSRFA